MSIRLTILTVSLLGCSGAAVLGYQEYQRNQTRFTQADQAYQVGDCQAALQKADELSKSWLGFLGHHAAKGQVFKRECDALLQAEHQAIAAVNNRKPDAALLLYNNFINTYPQSLLVQYARQKVGQLFAINGPVKLATVASCPQLKSFRQNKIIPKPQANVPFFLWRCNQLYAAQPQTQLEIGFDFLSEFSGHGKAFDIKSSIASNTLACEQTAKFQAQPAIAKTNLMPVLYLVCAKTAQDQLDFKRSLNWLNLASRHYSKQPINQEVDQAKTSVDLEIQAVQEAVRTAYTSLQAAIAVCTAMNTIPLVKFIEPLSGQDCLSGQKLSNQERALGLVPWSSLGKVGKAVSLVRKVHKIFLAVQQVEQTAAEQRATQSTEELVKLLREGESEDLALLVRYNPDLKLWIDRTRGSFDLKKHHAEALKLLRTYK